MKRLLFVIIVSSLSLPVFVHAQNVPLPAAVRYMSGEPIRVLLVPGHDDEYSGAVFNGVKEADINLTLADKIAAQFAGDPRFQVAVARYDGGYIPALQEYFDENEKAVERFIASHKRRMDRAIDRGTIEVGEQVPHGDAPGPVAYRLYAINKWVDEQKFDLVIHIHFNDYGSRPKSGGEYRGYSVYVPQRGLPNAVFSKMLGHTIAERLNNSLYRSDMPSELKKADQIGVIEDFNLIAMGAYGTLLAPSVLVEYSYMYEPVASPQLFATASDALARATAFAVREYATGAPAEDFNLKYEFKTALRESQSMSSSTLALQLALRESGVFPPADFAREECAIDGIFGKCTKAALKEFQKKHGLLADGIAGKKTLEKLNSMFAG